MVLNKALKQRDEERVGVLNKLRELVSIVARTTRVAVACELCATNAERRDTTPLRALVELI